MSGRIVVNGGHRVCLIPRTVVRDSNPAEVCVCMCVLGMGPEFWTPMPPEYIIPSKKCVFGKKQILSILTHRRDLDAKLPGKLPEFRRGSFLFS